MSKAARNAAPENPETGRRLQGHRSVGNRTSALPPALLILVVLLSSLPASLRAASYDPHLTWRTISTTHFNITYHDGEEQLALEMARICGKIWGRVTRQLDSQPKRPVELVLVDNTDSANGYAMRLPVNTIVIYVTAPQEGGTLSLYSDWNEAILTHELTHIVHLDTVKGLPRLLRLVLGRIVSVNDISPGWIVEGLAVYQETLLTDGGRGRSSYVDMIKRMTVLEDHFPPLGNLDGFQADPPSGNLRYLFGQDFLDFIARETGRDKIRDWVHVYGGWLPYWLPARRVFGKSFKKLYREWRADMEQRYQVQKDRVLSAGPSESDLVSDGEAVCTQPTFSPDGHALLYTCYDRATGPAIWLADGQGRNSEKILEEYSSVKGLSWRGDGRAFAFAVPHIVDYYNYFYDIRLHDLDSEETETITSGARARDPAFSPDGRELIVVTNDRQNNDLARLTVDRRLVPLTQNRDHSQLSTPRFSPDGRWIALSAWTGGNRTIWIYRSDGTPYRRVFPGDTWDIDPAWSPDGRRLFFSSDRDGIWNIYAIDLATEHLWRVTNVLGGAFQPSLHPDGKSLAYSDFTYDGQDIRLMGLTPSSWLDMGTIPPSGGPPLASLLAPPNQAEVRPKNEGAGDMQPGPGPGNGTPDRVPPPMEPHDNPGETTSTAHGADYPEKRYNPLPTLLPPRFLAPSAYITDYGFLGVLGTSGTDTLRHYYYSGFLTYRTDNSFVGGGGSVILNRWHPVYSMGAYLSTVRYGNLYLEGSPPDEGGPYIPGIEKGDDIYYDKRSKFWGQVAIPKDERRTYYIKYEGLSRTSLYDLPADAYLAYLPTRGFLSTLGGGWRYAWGSSYPYSISPEKGRAINISAETTTSLLGSHTLDDQGESQPFDQVQFTAEWREYLSLPWLSNHVLGLRGAVGLSLGDRLNYGSFRLGGSYGEGSLYVLPDEYRSLRGFPVATVYGDWYYLASVEYRLPLLRIDRGAGTLPFFVRTLHAAVFSDLGNAFDSLPQAGDEMAQVLTDTLVGLGAELRLGVVLGWGWGFTGRLGYAFALLGDGYSPGDLGGLYAQMGTSF